MNCNSWIHVCSRQLRKYRTLRIREDTYHFTPRGSQADFVVCESADWVLVIPVTPDQQVVLVNQFRHGIGGIVLEIPGGVMEDGETPVETAARELQEETGYVAERLEELPPFLPNPAIHTAKCHVVLATGCQCKADTQFDPFEDIELKLRPFTEIPAMIRSGELLHALTIAAFSVQQLHSESAVTS